jgi:hypothetical protein
VTVVPKLWLIRPSRPACRSQVSLWPSCLRARDTAMLLVMVLDLLIRLQWITLW